MKRIQKWLAVVLTACFCLSAATAAASALDAAPASEIPVGGTFYFGSYPQSRVTDSGLLSRLNSKGAYEGNVVSLDGGTYQCVRVTNYAVPGGDQGKIYTEIYGYEVGRTYWFRVEPIAWKVLAADSDEVLLMSKKVLTTHEYNKTIKADNTWKNSDIRSWLNEDFASSAFTPKEQGYIKLSDTPNFDSFIPGTSGVGGSDTVDRVFLPSFEEITDKTLGFNADCTALDDFGNPVGYYEKEPLRQAYSTDFARSKGLWVDTIGTGDNEVERIDGDPWDVSDDLDNVEWEYYPEGGKTGFSKMGRYWLRSGGSYSPDHASAVLENGRVTTGWPVNYTIVGICPWMRVSPDAVFDGTFVPPQTGDFTVGGIDSEIRYRQPNLKLTADAEGVTWTSSDESVAKVDADGNVTVVGVGTVTFTATDANGDTVSKTVEVRYTVWQWIVRIFLFGWLWY